MAFFRGDEGSVKFATDGTNAEAVVAATTSWSLNITKDVLDCTKQGDNSRSYLGSVYSGSGSVELLYDGGDNAVQEALIGDVLTTDDPADADFELYMGAGNKKIEFGGIVTSVDFNAALGDVQTISVGFQTSGDIDLSGLE